MTEREPIMRIFLCGWILIAAVAAGACREAPGATAIAAAPVDNVNSTAAMPHGDHSPHHGGTVYMYGEVHYEVILNGDGHHRVYFSDAVREDLPASVASKLTFISPRPRFTCRVTFTRRGGNDAVKLGIALL